MKQKIISYIILLCRSRNVCAPLCVCVCVCEQQQPKAMPTLINQIDVGISIISCGIPLLKIHTQQPHTHTHSGNNADSQDHHRTPTTLPRPLHAPPGRQSKNENTICRIFIAGKAIVLLSMCVCVSPCVCAYLCSSIFTCAHSRYICFCLSRTVMSSKRFKVVQFSVCETVKRGPTR